MISLSQAVDDYLAMRRALGYKLIEHGRVLPQFAEFLAQRGESLITIELALEFAIQPAGASVVWWHQRLAIVRGFARYLQAFNTRHEVPPVNLLPAKFRRAVPYLFSEAEIEALMHAARSMRGPLRAASCEAMIGLLAVTGMRVSEACALDRSDVELGEGRLTVRQGKNGRSREIPLHPSTVQALERYARARDQLCPHPKDPGAFFLSGWGGRPCRHHVWRWFDQLRRATGLDRETLARQARLHDVRHTFVLRTLLGWYREADDIEAHLPLLATVLGHVDPADTYWYLEGAPELLALAAERLERTWDEPASPANGQAHPAAPPAMEVATNPAASSKGWPVSALAPLLQAFFTERLARQRDASPHTTASYRDSFRLLLEFLHEQIGKSPAKLQLEDLDAARITAFLSYLENERSNSVRTRNARLTAIHSFFHFAALKAPECAEQIARVLAIPDKRYESTLISYLTEPEIDALLTAPDRSTPTGRRDYALLLLAVQTGLRASELASLRRQDLNPSSGWVRCEGKGRKERCTPLSRAVRQVLRAWLRELGAEPDSPLFPNPSGRHLTRSGIWRLVAKHATAAGAQCPSLAGKNITPHTLRHTAAMRLLRAPDPVDAATIALWLGHESLDSTNKYLHADMELKRRALDRTTPTNAKPGRYRAPDRLLAFLESL